MTKRGAVAVAVTMAMALTAVAMSAVAVDAACPQHDQISHLNPLTDEARIVLTVADGGRTLRSTPIVRWGVNAGGAFPNSATMNPIGGGRFERRGIRIPAGGTLQYTYAMEGSAGESCPTQVITVTKGQIPVVQFNAQPVQPVPLPQPMRTGHASPAAPKGPLDLPPSLQAQQSQALKAAPLKAVKVPLRNPQNVGSASPSAAVADRSAASMTAAASAAGAEPSPTLSLYSYATAAATRAPGTPTPTATPIPPASEPGTAPAPSAPPQALSSAPTPAANRPATIRLRVVAPFTNVQI